MFDLSGLELTTPQKKPNGTTALTVAGDQLDQVSQFAYYDGDDLMLWAPTTGATTASVKRTRTELKGQPFYLADAEVNRAGLPAKVEKVNWAGEFVILQAHCDDGNDPTVKTFIDGEAVTVGVRTKASTTDPKKQTVYVGLDLSRPFTLDLELSNTGVVTLTVAQDRTETATWQLEPKRAARPHVFHWGVYNQVDKGSDQEPAGDGTLLRVLARPLEFHGAPPGVDFDQLLDAAEQLGGQPRKLELNRITDLIDAADIPKAEKAPLYTRIKALKKTA